MGHCYTCGCNHPTSVCPPEKFIVLTCKNCGNQDITPGDTLCVGITKTQCGQCDVSDWDVRVATLEDLKKHWKDYGKYCMNLSVLDLKKINSLTKYPSILTYHELGDRGCLKESVLIKFDDTDQTFASEKIDGTNARIILFPQSKYLIGSREDLLYSRNDLIFNPSMSIVETIKSVAEDTIRPLWKTLDQSVMVIFGEVYGGKTSKNGKNYSNGKTSFRIFDIAMFEAKEFEELLEMPIESIASWRDHSNQHFLYVDDIKKICEMIKCPMVHSLKSIKPPTSIEETYEWLKILLPGSTNVSIEGEGGRPEGVVIRTSNRSKIAKIRFEDYERTLRSRK
jgi:hypothetical protein